MLPELELPLSEDASEIDAVPGDVGSCWPRPTASGLGRVF
jgi:hypothetical protein